MPLEVSITTEEQVKITATPTTATGHPATVDGDVMFTVESGDCTLMPVDSMSVMVVSGDTPGDCVVMVTADADVGAGIETIQDTILVHVSHPKATSLGLQAGTPEPKP